jgi:hypothetical protein
MEHQSLHMALPLSPLTVPPNPLIVRQNLPTAHLSPPMAHPNHRTVLQNQPMLQLSPPIAHPVHQHTSQNLPSPLMDLKARIQARTLILTMAAGSQLETLSNNLLLNPHTELPKHLS